MMKNTLLIISILIFAIGGLSASELDPNVKTTAAKTIMIIFDQTINAPVDVVLKDAKGFKLLEESLNSKDAKSRKYNLKNLPVGNYTLEIHEDFKITTESITIDNDAVIVTDEDVTFKPVCSQTQDHWNINLLLLQKDADIIIYNTDEKPVYSAKFRGEQNVAQSFDISKLDKGNYNAVITVEGMTFREPVFVR